jgi:alpha/beta superfamily hydrolase
VRLYDFGFLRQCAGPLAVIQGDSDQFGPLPLLQALAATLPPGAAKVIQVAGADHGFDGRLDEVARGVASAIPPGIIGAPAPRPS